MAITKAMVMAILCGLLQQSEANLRFGSEFRLQAGALNSSQFRLKAELRTSYSPIGKYSRHRSSTSFAMSSRTINSSGRLGFFRASITTGPR